jgi:RNA polymerase sigma-70 factor (ECF subfamily)
MDRQAERRIDEYLVVCARLGDRRAFGRLAARWQSKLVVHAWRLLGDEEAARDAVQEAWSQIVRGLRALKDERAFGAWAYRIVTRRCARHISSVQHRRRLSDALGADTAAMTASRDGQSEQADVDRLRGALRALPPHQQSVVALYYLEEMSVGEVAVALEIPAGTVKTRLMHARRLLQAAMLGDEQCARSTM